MSLLAAYVVPHPPMIIPEVGLGEEKKIALTLASYRQVAREISELKPDTIILTTPHLTMYRDYFHIAPGKTGHGDFARFGAPQVRLEADYDRDLILDLSLALAEESFPAGTEGAQGKTLDHGTMVPLYFIREVCQDFRILRVGLSGLGFSDHYRLGRFIREAVERLNRRAVFVASGDLSHRLKSDGPYGYDPQGPAYDGWIMDILSRAAFGEFLTMDQAFCEAAGECGHRSFAIMAGSLDRTEVEALKLSYEGPFGVGYGVATFHVTGVDPARNFLDYLDNETRQKKAAIRSKASPPVRLALAVIKAKLEGHVLDLTDYIQRENLPQEMLSGQAGVFVTLYKEGQLRGCIGTISPTTQSVAQEILRNAVESAFHDPRFPPLDMAEFPDLKVSVDVLLTPEAIDSLDALNPREYGVIVTRGSRRGLLLPDLAGITTPFEQIRIAKDKAGIGPNEPVSVERFKVVRYH